MIYRDRWRERTSIHHDTLYVELTDSVSVPYPVEKQLTHWQQTKVNYGGYALFVSATVICLVVAWLARKFRK
ncbi:MAG: hypothetical protein NC548_31790 [Lachnospiraceae bacterium]|nr:hypothetical protein [Lachnospiraceae bacterium]